MTRRIQRKRIGRSPPGVIYVGRPTKWGNPYVVNPLHEGAGLAVAMYREALLSGRLRVSVDDVRRELRGRRLSCWCPVDLPCHADVLLDIAN